MNAVYYISEEKLYRFADGDSVRIPCGAVDQYQQTVKEIERNRGWKTQGIGASFMGVAIPQADPTDVHTSVESAVIASDEKLIYAAALETSCAVYGKNPQKPEADEEYIVRKTNTRLYSIDYDPVDKLIVASASDGYIEKHLALIGEERANFRIVTEGESVDIAPSFSRKNNKVIHFSSTGFYRDRKTGVHYSNYVICKYDLVSNEVTEILSDEKYDFLYPKQAEDGRLYCIRRLKEEPKDGPTFFDVVTAPVRLLRAIFGWLNFFTQRYSGESLVKGTGGQNPAKDKKKTDQEIFIEGNLINADKTLQENKLQGEKYPGIAPKSWELVIIGADKTADVVKKGVLDYTFGEDGSLIFSNGKYIIKRQASGVEDIICEAKIARSLCVGR